MKEKTMMGLKHRSRLGLLSIFLIMFGCIHHSPCVVEQKSQLMAAPFIEVISDAVGKQVFVLMYHFDSIFKEIE